MRGRINLKERKELILMKKWISLLGILCMTVFFIVGAEAKQQSPKQIDGFQIQEDELNDEYVQGVYPEIIKAEDLSAKIKINEQIDKVIDNLKTQVKKDNEYSSDIIGNVSYNVNMNSNELFSVEINCTTKHKQTDADKGNTYMYSLNFDKQGNLIDFAQIAQSSKISGDDIEQIDKIEQIDAQLWQQMDKNIEDMRAQMVQEMNSISPKFISNNN